MKKILFIAAHRPDRSPSQRFRFEQYFKFLHSNGYDYQFSYIISEKDDKIFYSKGNYFSKGIIFLKATFKRLNDILSANQYDIIFIQREAFFLGTTFFEFLLSKSKAKLIFDFDDSIWLQQVTDRSANKNLLWLKNPAKTKTIIKYCDLVFAGNQYLADYATAVKTPTVIVPTTIDTEEYSPLPKINNDTVCIGWSGSVTTIDHFAHVIPALKRIKEKYGSKVSFKVIGDSKYINEELNIIGIGWNKKDEIKELCSFDIGVMPLPDDEWARGKCGLKGLQYMALEIPTIMSPVGVNGEIIQQGVNGFLASSEDEWVKVLSLLIESKDMRIQLGANGRKTVVEKYSVEAQKGNYIRYFNQLLDTKE